MRVFGSALTCRLCPNAYWNLSLSSGYIAYVLYLKGTKGILSTQTGRKEAGGSWPRMLWHNLPLLLHVCSPKSLIANNHECRWGLRLLWNSNAGSRWLPGMLWFVLIFAEFVTVSRTKYTLSRTLWKSLSTQSWPTLTKCAYLSIRALSFYHPVTFASIRLGTLHGSSWRN